jgi:hypothetical protein
MNPFEKYRKADTRLTILLVVEAVIVLGLCAGMVALLIESVK